MHQSIMGKTEATLTQWLNNQSFLLKIGVEEDYLNKFLISSFLKGGGIE
jgi:hypothetical protein